MSPETKRCSKCGEVKPLEEFHRDRSRKPGHDSPQCRECERQYEEGLLSQIDCPQPRISLLGEIEHG